MQCGYKKADIPFGFPSKCPPYKLTNEKLGEE